MKTRNFRPDPTLILTAVISFAAVVTSLGQTKTWTGGGDATSWANGANWSGGTMPASSDNVVIDSGAGTTVVISTGNIIVRSLQCTKAFTISGGSLKVTGGASEISGTLTITNDATLTVSGAAVTFTASGPTTANDANLYASYGGALRLPNLRSVTNNNQNSTWHADGAGGTLDLSSLTNVVLGFYRKVWIEASTGGAIDLHRLSDANVAVDVDVRDAASVVDLSGLAGRWKSLGNSPLDLRAQTGASILIPNVTQFENASVRIDNTGVIPTAQLTLLTNVSITADACSPNFGRVTNIDETTIYAQNGGVVRLTNVFRVIYNKNNPTWSADRGGSMLDLSAVTNIDLGFYRTVWIVASDSGTVDLHRLRTAEGALDVDARGAGSVVDLSGLQGRWRSLGNSAIQLEAQTGASVLIPNVTQLEKAQLRVHNTGAITTAQLNLLTNVSLTADACGPNFGAVTNLDDTQLNATKGGVLRFPNVFRATVQALNPTWHADGAGGVVDLSSLTNLTLGFYRTIWVEVLEGGTVDLHRLRAADGALDVDARDPGSVVDLSGLAGRWTSLGNSAVRLEAQTGASILIPNVTQIEHGQLSIHNTGNITTAQLNLLTNVSLAVDGASPNFGGVTNIDDTSVSVVNGGLARLTNVFSAAVLAQNVTWHAEGVGALIDLSSLTNLTVGFYRMVWVEALSGGVVDLHRLKHSGQLDIDARNPGSVVDLSGLTGTWRSDGNSPVKLEAQTGASILIPNVTQLEDAEVLVHGSGTIPTAELRMLTNVNLTVDGSAPNFGQVTNIDDTSVHVLNAGVARLTNVFRFACNQQNSTWEATGAGSLLDLSSVTRLSVGFYRNLDVSAKSGGKVDLHSLASLSTGAVDILADGSGSVVDLRGISSFVGTGNGPSSVTARNSGVVLFNDSVFLLANVSINIPPGNPVLPPVLAASPAVSLYGKAWHAYWVEKRDTRIADAPWVFLARVPLMSSLQPIIPRVDDHMEYRVWDFEADPPIADMSVTPRGEVFMVVYDTPGKTNEVSTSQSLLGSQPWQSSYTTVMTNAFRIRQLPNPVEPQRFFQVKRL